MRAIAWEVVQKQSFRKEAQFILAAGVHQSHKLELLWNIEGASTGPPDIQVLETAYKSAQAVVVWSQLLQRQQL